MRCIYYFGFFFITIFFFLFVYVVSFFFKFFFFLNSLLFLYCIMAFVLPFLSYPSFFFLSLSFLCWFQCWILTICRFSDSFYHELFLFEFSSFPLSFPLGILPLILPIYLFYLAYSLFVFSPLSLCLESCLFRFYSINSSLHSSYLFPFDFFYIDFFVYIVSSFSLNSFFFYLMSDLPSFFRFFDFSHLFIRFLQLCLLLFCPFFFHSFSSSLILLSINFNVLFYISSPLHSSFSFVFSFFALSHYYSPLLFSLFFYVAFFLYVIDFLLFFEIFSFFFS
ncbi:unnamed protein product [Acanthosepion pharaonis]|uniref:Uncharacterized protein n=1 Tax=Acanthosepion pharaonis TaxID=158019 RepID=A0A812DTA0_ACAPH|nr:unnamed protein product [Sepia pharaonis]